VGYVEEMNSVLQTKWSDMIQTVVYFSVAMDGSTDEVT
jgi:hypothetical protein